MSTMPKLMQQLLKVKNKMSALDEQQGGSHYKNLVIQPIEYIHANNIPFIEGNIIKYITRWRDKGGLDDLKKVIHFTELLIELENFNVGQQETQGASSEAPEPIGCPFCNNFFQANKA